MHISVHRYFNGVHVYVVCDQCIPKISIRINMRYGSLVCNLKSDLEDL